MRMREFIKQNKAEIDAAINGVMYRHDGRGGRGVIPTPAPVYNNDMRIEWIKNDEGLYRWARAAGVRI